MKTPAGLNSSAGENPFCCNHSRALSGLLALYLRVSHSYFISLAFPAFLHTTIIFCQKQQKACSRNAFHNHSMESIPTNDRLWELERQVFQLSTLFEVAQTLAACRDSESIYAGVLAILSGTFGGPGGGIFRDRESAAGVVWWRVAIILLKKSISGCRTAAPIISSKFGAAFTPFFKRKMKMIWRRQR
jgi:hypothetical protein